MTDSLTVFGTDFTGVTGIKATGTGNGTLTYIRPQGSETKTANGTYDVTNLATLVVNLTYSTIYTGTSDPSSSQGINGDVYLKTVS